jgi:hypothetical protein
LCLQGPSSWDYLISQVNPANLEPVLSQQEASRLRELEETIQDGFDSFLRIGLAFAEIRHGRLYRNSHDTFESYCQSRWALSLSRCNQIARTMAVYDNIVAAVPQDVTLLASSNEHTLRPLASLSEELQPLAWQLCRKIKQEPDTAIIEEVVETIKAAIATGWQEREKQVLENEAATEASPAPDRNGTTPHRQGNELAALSRWVNRVTTWDPTAIALADDELRLKAHLRAARQLRTFCDSFIEALETRLSN